MEESTSVPKLDTHLERKITTNNWIIRTRWFYPVGILLIGLLTKIEPIQFEFFLCFNVGSFLCLSFGQRYFLSSDEIF
jgi:hypothetical protein